MTERKETDRLETLTAARLSPDDQTDSPSSESDAGLDDPVIEDQGPINTGQSVRGAFDIDAELPARPIEEIPMCDLDDGMEDDFLMSPELADMNVPGEVDIEELDDDALDNTDLPEDARLDRLEE